MTEKKCAILKLYRGSVPSLVIRYKDKDDLFEKFMSKINKLCLTIDEIYGYDMDGDPIVIKNADDLMVMIGFNYQVKIRVRSANKTDIFSCPNHNRREGEENLEKIKISDRSPSSAHVRRRSRSEPRHRSHRHVEESYRPVSWNYAPWIDPCCLPWYYGPWVDPRCLPLPFFRDSIAHGKGCCHHNQTASATTSPKSSQQTM